MSKRTLKIEEHGADYTRMTTKRYTKGRGSNPASRQNLTGPMRDAYVYERGAGIGWSKLAGPMTYRQASEHAAKLEAMNHSGCKPMYAATRGQA